MNKRSLRQFLTRQSFVVVFCLTFVILGTATLSYGIYSLNISSTKNQVVESGSFNVNFRSGNVISSDVYMETDEEGMARSGYSLSVTNSSSMPISYAILLGRNTSSIYSDLVPNSYIKYSIDGSTPQILSNSKVYSGNSDSDYKYIIKEVNKNTAGTTNHNIKVWIDYSLATSSAINKYVDLAIQVVALTSDPSQPGGLVFGYSGQEVVYTVPYTGTYKITAAGAQGAQGNRYGNLKSTVIGGKGAKISAEFDLEEGDKLHIIAGGQGITSTGTAANGASGAGGGGSFVFKEIASKTDSRYQFTKSSKNYDVLLVAAGGGGTGDLGYSSYKSYAGYPGYGATYYSPSNFQAYSTTVVTSGTNSSTQSSPLGISQYINNAFTIKPTYTLNGSKCVGGFGGGTCSGDARSYGGGWRGSGYYTYSWSQGANTVGVNGAQFGNGYVTLELIK